VTAEVCWLLRVTDPSGSSCSDLFWLLLRCGHPCDGGGWQDRGGNCHKFAASYKISTRMRGIIPPLLHTFRWHGSYCRETQFDLHRHVMYNFCRDGPDDGGSKHVRNVGEYLPDCTVQHSCPTTGRYDLLHLPRDNGRRSSV
jgi:hypothetical protein